MTKLQAPLHEQLDSTLPEADVHRMWLGIGERRRRMARPARGGLARPAVAAALAALAAVVALWVVRPPWLPGFAGSAREAVVSGPLLKLDGQAPLSLGGKEPDSVALTDGSHITLQGASKLEVIDNDGKRFVSALRSGTARFEVKPGGHRRWTVEAGLASIEVVGTGFTVRRSEREVEVSVSHGTVIVRGQFVPDQVQRLGAGDRLVVTAPPEGTPTPPASVQVLPEAPAVEPGSAPAVAASAETSGSPLRPEERAAHYLAQADRARGAGNIEEAIAALRKALAHAEGSQAAMTSFTLGKLLLDAAQRPHEAEQAFARCLALGPPAALAEDALARLVEAQARSGRVERARTTAAEYERRYPTGRRLPEVQRWAGAP